MNNELLCKLGESAERNVALTKLCTALKAECARQDRQIQLLAEEIEALQEEVRRLEERERSWL